MGGYTLYPPEPVLTVAIRAGLALLPLVLATLVSRRMGRGWLLMSAPWLLLLAALAVYAVPAIQFSRTLGQNLSLVIFGHLIARAAPVGLTVTLLLLAVLGVKRADTQAEPA